MVNNLLVVIVVVFRILAAIYIFFNIFWGFLVTLVFDFIDAYFLRQKAKLSWNRYQLVDKALDIIPYSVMLIVSIKYGVFSFLLLLFIYRLIGEILFFVTKKTFYLILFPNFFSIAFILFVFLQEVGINFDISSVKYFVLMLFFFLLQIIFEIVLHKIWPKHIRKRGYPSFVRKLGYIRRG